MISLLLFLPLDPGAVRERVEIIEVNHHHDESGHEVFCQVIFWREDYRCIAWRMNNERKLDPAGRVSWFMDSGIVRRVEARTVIETWSQAGVGGDPEQTDQGLLPKAFRQELRK